MSFYRQESRPQRGDASSSAPPPGGSQSQIHHPQPSLSLTHTELWGSMSECDHSIGMPARPKASAIDNGGFTISMNPALCSFQKKLNPFTARLPLIPFCRCPSSPHVYMYLLLCTCCCGVLVVRVILIWVSGLAQGPQTATKGWRFPPSLHHFPSSKW